MKPLRVLDLFSGIGGFSLGLERTGGFETVAFCEIEPYCRKVLAKHWPDVRCYDDVRTLTADALCRDGIAVDAICGGFPCQDISFAGKGAGIEGERSGLWSEYARLIGELRPRIIIVENVSALLGRGLARVLGDLAALGYDAEWHCIRAADVGAPHLRERIWIVAYAQSDLRRTFGNEIADASDWASVDVADAEGVGWRQGATDSRGREARGVAWAWPGSAGSDQNLAHPDSRPLFGSAVAWEECNSWPTEPDVGRVAHGVPGRVDRLRALGNAVVPQIPELIGRAILAARAAA